MAHKGNNWIWAALGIGAGIFLASRKASAMTTYKAPLQLSKNFNLTEFLRQHKGLESYALTQREFDAVSRLVTKILQPARDKFGPLQVSSGCRPPEWRAPEGSTITVNGKPVDVSGKSLDEILIAEGYHPSPNSDHDFCGAADTIPDSPDKIMPLAMFYAGLPDTRQVILEYHTGPDGKRVFNTVHVAVITPGRGKISGDTYAFVQVDGKRQETIPWQKPLV